MLSIAAIGSASGAAAYYAGDNYYTDGQLTEASLWHGKGAELLGLSGKVDHDKFDAVLAGKLPDGSVVPDGARGSHRPGLDLTFSAPKSVSLLAYVGGDDRLLVAHMAAVKSALTWAEARLAQAKVSGDKAGGQTLVPTGNLVIALFQHDTSRALDPQAHIHAVIANGTKAPDGKWHALAERSLWEGKTTIASVYNAAFRQGVETLGYATSLTGKHGQFEIDGVDRDAIRAFSQRRAEIEAEATKLQHNTPAAMAAVTLRTRGEKPANVDRATLHAEWQARAEEIGFRPQEIVAAAVAWAERVSTPWSRLTAGVKGLAAQGLALAEALGLIDPRQPVDPLVPERPGRMPPDQFAAAHAVASAVRHLSEREAGFRSMDLVKAALDLGAPVDVHLVEQRIASLVDKGLLIRSGDGRMVTTADAVRGEQAYLAAVREGQGKAGALLTFGKSHNAARDGQGRPPRDNARYGSREEWRSAHRESAREIAKDAPRESARDGWRDGARDGVRETAKDMVPAHTDTSQSLPAIRLAVVDAARDAGLKLTKGQRAAAVTILASQDRVVHVQGNAGTGKSAMLAPVARLVEGEGRKVMGLAVSNAIANRLKTDIGIETMTVARFLYQNRALLDPHAQDPATVAAREVLKAVSTGGLTGALLVVDEASMLSTRDAAKLVAIANAAGVGRLALIGDTRQLGAVEAGKPFALGQDRETATMSENLRAKTPEMRAIHSAAQGHDMHRLARLVKPHTTETPGTAAETAASRWMALPSADRSRTAIFVSGRQLRSEVNAAVQQMRKAAGELGERVTVAGALTPVHITREEQKLPQTYRPGQVIELARPLISQTLPRGLMTVVSSNPKGVIKVRLPDGREAAFQPERLAANRVEDAVRLFEARDLTLQVGDAVRWTGNDRARNIANGEQATLIARQQDALLFRTSDAKDLRLERDDPMLKRIDLAYATNAHTAQGATADRAIIVAHSREGALISSTLTAVLFTRAREQVELVTDSLPKLEMRAAMNIGAKTAAVEVAGQENAARVSAASVATPQSLAMPQTQPSAHPPNAAAAQVSNAGKSAGSDREIEIDIGSGGLQREHDIGI